MPDQTQYSGWAEGPSIGFEIIPAGRGKNRVLAGKLRVGCLAELSANSLRQAATLLFRGAPGLCRRQQIWYIPARFKENE